MSRVCMDLLLLPSEDQCHRQTAEANKPCFCYGAMDVGTEEENAWSLVWEVPSVGKEGRD